MLEIGIAGCQRQKEQSIYAGEHTDHQIQSGWTPKVGHIQYVNLPFKCLNHSSA